MYTDDTSIYHFSKDITQLNTALNEEVRRLDRWLKGNKLSLKGQFPVRKNSAKLFSRNFSSEQYLEKYFASQFPVGEMSLPNLSAKQFICLLNSSCKEVMILLALH